MTVSHKKDPAPVSAPGAWLPTKINVQRRGVSLGLSSSPVI